MSDHRHRVLVVDDDEDARVALRELLQLQGYDVATAGDGAQALAQLRGGFEPCLVLLDLHMAGMNGWQFRKEQMRDPALRDLNVVVFSGGQHEEEAARELGIRQYLRKPIDFDALFAMLDRYCGLVKSPRRADKAS